MAAYEPPQLLDMVSVAAPMAMHVTYSFEPHPRGTLAAIRVRGGPGGLLRLAAPLVTRQVRTSLTKDLRDLGRWGENLDSRRPAPWPQRNREL
ncbi:hypothetical protein [Streptomyces sp. NBC_01092]|uniref:hypothetical protein n=1 Tax=Streptomyces sp. NBC_01092 TaxID=2903748 RepID=UPI0038704A8A|nr:hypothetical protein OG254_04175 [Streptomyces sp. NBC_01092]